MSRQAQQIGKTTPKFRVWFRPAGWRLLPVEEGLSPPLRSKVSDQYNSPRHLNKQDVLLKATPEKRYMAIQIGRSICQQWKAFRPCRLV